MRIDKNSRGSKSRTVMAVLIFFVFLPFVAGPAAEAKSHPRAIRGVLDLRNWDFHVDGPVTLSGEWGFYWMRLVRQDDLDFGRAPEQTGFIRVPSSWNSLAVDGQKLSGMGYGTYQLEVLLKNPLETMALRFLSVGTAFQADVNGRRVTSAGVVGTTPQYAKPEWQPHVASFQTDRNRLNILLRVSNFHHRRGGVSTTIYLGLQKDITAMRERSIAVELCLSGSIFIMGLYHIGLFVLRRKEKGPLYFGLFCLLIAIYTLLSGERFFAHIFPASTWAFRVKLTNLTSFMSVPFFMTFLYSLFPAEFKKRLLPLFTIPLSCLSVIVLVAPAIFYSQLIPLYHGITILSGLFAGYVLVAAVRKKREGAIVFLIGFSLFFIFVLNDVLYDYSILQTGQLIGIGLFIFIFSQSFLLSLRFSSAFNLSERQQRELLHTNVALNREISERKLAEKALVESEEKYRLLAENVKDNIWIWDLDQARFTYISPSIKDLTGYAPVEAMALTLDQILTPSSSSIATGMIQEELAREERSRVDWSGAKCIEVEILRRDGSTLWAEVTASFLLDDHGRPNRILGVTRDITERKQAEGLRKAKMEAEASSKAKSDFLANMSHELRTPLNHIMGFTELILGKNFGALTKIQEEYLGDVFQSSRHLLSLINDILDISKVEAGKLELNLGHVELRLVLENSLVMVKEKALQHGIQLNMNVDSIPEGILADERKLKQVMYNLLSNAVKFTLDGGVVKVTAHSCTVVHGAPFLMADGDYVEISVTDSGIGIRKEDLERIFDPFEQVENTASRKYQGTGLGLSLTKSLVELHGGRIWAESDGEGKGSTFRVVLPGVVSMPGGDGRQLSI